MKRIRLLAWMLIAGALLAVGAGSIGRQTASAQDMGPALTISGDTADISCAQADENWTDCTITLNQDIASGDYVMAMLPDDAGFVAYCNDGLPLETNCGVVGNMVFFSCPSGCDAGSQFTESLLGANGPMAAEQIAVMLAGA